MLRLTYTNVLVMLREGVTDPHTHNHPPTHTQIHKRTQHVDKKCFPRIEHNVCLIRNEELYFFYILQSSYTRDLKG